MRRWPIHTRPSVRYRCRIEREAERATLASQEHRNSRVCACLSFSVPIRSGHREADLVRPLRRPTPALTSSAKPTSAKTPLIT
jgi:hypothetical protein